MASSRLRRALRTFRRLGPAGLLALAATALPAVGALVLYSRLSMIAAWTLEHSLAGPVASAGIFAVLGGAALVPTYALSVLSGWSFGVRVGVTCALAGFLGAALLANFLIRLADRGRVMRVVEESAKWRAVHAAMLRGSVAKVTLIVALVRLAHFAPFSLTNLALSSMRVPLPAYALGTVLGMAPRTFFIVFTASRLASLDVIPAEQPWVVAGSVLLTAAVCVVLGLIARRALSGVVEASGTGVAAG